MLVSGRVDGLDSLLCVFQESRRGVSETIRVRSVIQSDVFFWLFFFFKEFETVMVGFLTLFDLA